MYTENLGVRMSLVEIDRQYRLIVERTENNARALLSAIYERGDLEEIDELIDRFTRSLHQRDARAVKVLGDEAWERKHWEGRGYGEL